jgi:hypothetical protein
MPAPTALKLVADYVLLGHSHDANALAIAIAQLPVPAAAPVAELTQGGTVLVATTATRLRVWLRSDDVKIVEVVRGSEVNTLVPVSPSPAAWTRAA